MRHSIKATCGKPILYVGMGEKLSDLEQFYPERMASRILGMGDVMTLIEKAQANIDEDKAREMEQKLKKHSLVSMIIWRAWLRLKIWEAYPVS